MGKIWNKEEDGYCYGDAIAAGKEDMIDVIMRNMTDWTALPLPCPKD
jgi:hypothetical protein